jgi:hypothetical protein
MSDRMLTDGSPVPEDGSHKELKPNGQQKGYVVLTAEERAKGFVKPVRRTYVHETCGSATSMGIALSETYARNPRFYSGTYCVGCGTHFALNQFHWDDNEPMDPDLQEEWHLKETIRKDIQRKTWRFNRITALKAELADLEKEASQCDCIAAVSDVPHANDCPAKEPS